jgi:tetratricopeptide (TPR) repeat protein
MKKYIFIIVAIGVFLILHFGQKYFDERSGNFFELNKEAFKNYKMARLLKEEDLNKSNEHYDLAIEYYKKALLVDPSARMNTYLNLTNIYIERRQWEQAKSTLEEALKHYPIEEKLYQHLIKTIKKELNYNCSNIYDPDTCAREQAKAHQNVIGIMSRFVNKSPTHKVALQELGHAYLEAGEYDLALEYFNKALLNNINENENFKCQIYKQMGDVYTKKNQFDKAISYYVNSKNTVKTCSGLAESLRELKTKMKAARDRK